MTYIKTLFGLTGKGDQTYLYTFENRNGMKLMVTDLGAIITGILVPDKDKRLRDVVLGYDTPKEYEGPSLFFGAVVGRNANRIGGPEFTIGENKYVLPETAPGLNLHSGPDFYRTRIWKVTDISDDSITLLMESKDGDQGFPGNALIYVTYKLTDNNEVRIIYKASADADTVFNLTNHSYFNLNGCSAGLYEEEMNILSHEVMIAADAFTPTDAVSIPSGEIRSVLGTPMDFRKFKKIGDEIDAEYDQLKMAGGYDHNWAVNGEGMRLAAEMKSSVSGISLSVYSDLPGIQFYTSNYVDDRPGKGGVIYPKRAAACFETQFFPDAVNHENFKSPIVKAGEEYNTETVFRFEIK